MTNQELRYSVRKTNLECLTEKKKRNKVQAPETYFPMIYFSFY